MIQKNIHIFIFSIFLCLPLHTAFYTPKTSPSLTPHPSLHLDETNSSQISRSTSMTPQSSSNSSNHSISPEPQNPHVTRVSNICEVINIDPEILLEQAKNLTKKSVDPRTSECLKKLYNLGLLFPISVQFEKDNENKAPVSYNPKIVTIRDTFFKKNKTQQLIILMQTVHRLNNSSFEIETVAKEHLESNDLSQLTFEKLKKELQDYYAKLDCEAIKILINNAVSEKQYVLARKLEAYLTTPCDEATPNSATIQSQKRGSLTGKRKKDVSESSSNSSDSDPKA